MAEKRKRGRPIKWEEAFKKYQLTALYYTNRANTQLSSHYIQDIDQFKEQVTGYRETYGWTVGKATSVLAQKAGMNDATLSQVQALQRARMKQTGNYVSLAAAANMFSPRNKENEDVLKLAHSLGIETEEELAEAGRNGELSLSEVNIILVRQFGVMDSQSRKNWISQNIFGSL